MNEIEKNERLIHYTKFTLFKSLKSMIVKIMKNQG
jgi:hypothetical protein